jgi:hypothetical protein
MLKAKTHVRCYGCDAKNHTYIHVNVDAVVCVCIKLHSHCVRRQEPLGPFMAIQNRKNGNIAMHLLGDLGMYKKLFDNEKIVAYTMLLDWVLPLRSSVIRKRCMHRAIKFMADVTKHQFSTWEQVARLKHIQT